MLKYNFLCCAIIFWISTTNSFPQQGYRTRRGYPRQTMMFSGFYGAPNSPKTSMAALASGDSAAANSFSANDYLSFMGGADGQNEEDYVMNNKRPELTEEREENIDEEKPVSKPKRKPQPVKPQVDEDEEDNLYATRGGSGHPAYNAYFPIFFGGQGGGHSKSNGNEGNFGSGAPIAIANSYSTGKGGIATSHATAYGDPLLSMYLRNRNNRKY